MHSILIKIGNDGPSRICLNAPIEKARIKSRTQNRASFKAEEGYEICAEAIDGHEAIALAIKHRPDLIILDLSMPVVNGLEASIELKKIMPDVPIILFTHHASLSNSLFGSSASVDGAKSSIHDTFQDLNLHECREWVWAYGERWDLPTGSQAAIKTVGLG